MSSQTIFEVFSNDVSAGPSVRAGDDKPDHVMAQLPPSPPLPEVAHLGRIAVENYQSQLFFYFSGKILATPAEFEYLCVRN